MTETEPREPIIIAGGGIAGLTMALSCHELGLPVRVYESSREIRPLGVGINLQPNAVRELIELGLGDRLPEIGVETKEWALVGRNGNDIWAEPRGRRAGYRWPQYSVHRGELQMLLLDTVRERCGRDTVLEGHRLLGYEQTSDSITAHFEDRASGTTVDVDGAVLIGADGLRSVARRQLFPDEGEPVWGGAVLWRGTSLGEPIRSGASFTLVGNLEQRFVHYPIGPVDPETGLQRQNWIAELTFDPDQGWDAASWNQTVDPAVFVPAFAEWDFEWLDIPALVGRAEQVWEYPMVDRDPAPTWLDGRMALIGDAAHVMYPVGSNGASQAIVDARVLGAAFVEHGVGPDALAAYEERLHEDVSALVLRNRNAGPIAILGEVDERCGGVFDDIDDVIPRPEIEAFMARYKQAAGFAMDALNEAPPTIAPGSRVP
jgi:2-polyprenyl-6-methoxyphenol hydroxylase-like FAD-dependent oxidoreductase